MKMVARNGDAYTSGNEKFVQPNNLVTKNALAAQFCSETARAPTKVVKR